MPGHQHASVQVVSAWVRQGGLSLGEVAIGQKTNEIEAVPDLLHLLDLQDTVVSADALNCQKKTAQAILDGGGDYLLGLKARVACSSRSGITLPAAGVAIKGTGKKPTAGLSAGTFGWRKTCVGLTRPRIGRDWPAWSWPNRCA